MKAMLYRLSKRRGDDDGLSCLLPEPLFFSAERLKKPKPFTLGKPSAPTPRWGKLEWPEAAKG
ncbi:hypothetical protein BJP41_03830 [Candidatus Williamhamiltonella defendens]|uniref:Uncharacterized protein n=1 Tax=Candidatus Williamhamiltonella defendens TaxID=138072 RepID=A0A2D3T7W6_9ENTR|nr:hypothetical protein BJP41_03830 [Candidatus Hamiltonella defensa]ATW31601.1 hypothetical protein BJP42_03890 [Candidatus Hamiltonella defensa]